MALELLAWSPDYFDDTVDVLARLAALDPDGSWSNRPHRSLVEICSAWLPNTTASTRHRLRALKRLLRDEPGVARQVLYDLIPDRHGTQLAHRAPRFRDWKREVQVTRAEVVEFVSTIVEMLLADLGTDAARYLAFIDKIDRVSPAHRREFAQQLAALGSTLEDDEARAQLYGAVRAKCAHHREYSDSSWAMPEEELAVLETAAAAVQPRAAIHQASWLFESDWITLGDLARRDDFDAYDEAVRERRANAIERVLTEGGLDSVADLAAGTSHPHLVGVALAQHTSAFDTEMLAWLSDVAGSKRDVAYAYLAARLSEDGPALGDYLLGLTNDAAVQAMILRATGDPPAAWAKLTELPQAVARQYWQGFVYFGLGGNFDRVLDAARGLLSARRYAAVIGLLALYERKVDTAEGAEVAAQACEGLLAAASADAEIGRLSSHDFERAFALLARHRDSVGRPRVIAIEWQLFPALGFQAQAPGLHAALAEEPDFFAELIGILYSRDDQADESGAMEASRASAGGDVDDGSVGDSPEPTDQQRSLVIRAWEVLHSWRTCPGLALDGTLDGVSLQAWVWKARERLKRDARLRPGEMEIGRILAFAPKDDDGMFPPRAVRELLEDVCSEQLERGLALGIFNKRGVTSRGLFDGGRQEWDLAASFRAQGEESQPWPRTRKLLRELADGYERDARREDEEAERRRRGLHD